MLSQHELYNNYLHSHILVKKLFDYFKIIDFQIKMNLPDYNCDQLLGKGSFGEVYQSSESNLATKVYQNLQNGLHEIRMLNCLDTLGPVFGDFLKWNSYYYCDGTNWFYQNKEDHYRIINHNQNWNGKSVLINMPRYDSNLTDFCNNCIKIGQLDTSNFIFLIFRSFYQIYQHFIIHGDIKFGNILVRNIKDTGTAREYYMPTLCDFNISFRQFGCLPGQFSKQDLEYIQTISYRSPELVLGCTDLSDQAEIWSLGVVVLKLTTGTNFFSANSTEQQICNMVKFFGYDEVIKYVEKNGLETKLPNRRYRSQKKKLLNQICDLKLQDLVAQILRLDPSERLDLKGVFHHPYFKLQVQLTGFQFEERQLKYFLDSSFEKEMVDLEKLEINKSNFNRETIFNQVADFLYAYHLPINILFHSIYLFDFLVSRGLLHYNQPTFVALVRIVGTRFYFSEHHAQLNVLSTLDSELHAFNDKIVLVVWNYLESPSPFDYIYLYINKATTLTFPNLRKREQIWNRLLEIMTDINYHKLNYSKIIANLVQENYNR